MKLKKRRVVLLLIALLLLGLAGWLCWLFEGGRLAVAMAKHRARVAGMPTTMEEILPPHGPDADNAAPVIAKLAPLLRALRLNSFKDDSGAADLIGVIAGERSERRDIRYFPFRNNSVYPDPKEDAKRLAAKRKKAEAMRVWLMAQLDSAPALAALAAIREAAAKPGYDPRVGYMRGSLPRWSDDGDPIEKGATLLSGYALLAADRGQKEDACADVWAMIQLADFLAKEPVLSRQWIRLRICRSAIEDMEQLAATGNLPPAWNRKFAGRLAALNPAGDLARDVSAAGVMGGEVYFEGILNGRISFSTISPSTSWGFPENFGDQIWYGFPGVVRSEYASYLDWHRQVSAAIAEPGISLMALDQRLQDVAAGITPNRKILGKLLPDASAMIKKGAGPSSRPLSVAWGPSQEWSRSSLGGMIRETWSFETNIAVAQVGLALDRYRADKGDYPPALAALVPEYLSSVPADVVAGNPLNYDRVPGGAAVHGAACYIGAEDSLYVFDFGLRGNKTVWLAVKAAE